MAVILAVDGGNSKTLAVVARDDGTVLGIGRAPGSNHQRHGDVAMAMNQVALAARRALSRAGVEESELAGRCYCLAGADFAEDFAVLEADLRSRGPGRVILDNDSAAVMWSGTSSPNAVAIIWGSGCNGLGRNEAGETIRFPAVGWISGDWGGGAEFAREAVRLVARAHDGRGAPTLLTDLVLRALDVPDPDAMIRKLYFGQQASYRPAEGSDGVGDESCESASLEHLAPLVFGAANAGDMVARDLVVRAGEEVAVSATALLRRLGLIGRRSEVVLGGSMFRGEGALLLDTVRRRLEREAPLARIVVPSMEPVLGALFFGMTEFLGAAHPQARERAATTFRSLTVEVRA